MSVLAEALYGIESGRRVICLRLEAAIRDRGSEGHGISFSEGAGRVNVERRLLIGVRILLQEDQS